MQLNRIIWLSTMISAGGFMLPAWPQTAQRHQLFAGPVYMSADGHDGPQFPRTEILVQIEGEAAPQQIAPSDLTLNSGGNEVGRGVAVRVFGDAGYGVQDILALDASGSMSGGPLNAVRRSIARFVSEARPQDQVEVLSFANETRIDVPFGASKDALSKDLQQIRSRGTETHLFDGLLDAIGQFKAMPLRRRLTVISDGHDEGSKHTIDDVIHQATAAHVSIDSVGLTRSHPEYLRVMAQLAQATGGRYAQAKSPDDLEGLVSQEIAFLKTAPVVTFSLTNLPEDGKVHELDLEWHPENLHATVDVSTPSENLLQQSKWLWLLGACFIAGGILLIVARVSSRRRRTAPVAPVTSTQLYREPQFDQRQAPRREATLSGTELRAQPRTAHESTRTEQAAQESFARTRVPAFFDSSHDAPQLDAFEGPLTGQSIPIHNRFRIGAVEGNELVIAGDPTLSGSHARFIYADSVLMIEDLQSTNGTYVNGLRLGAGRKLLKPGDEIRVGKSAFRLRTR